MKYFRNANSYQGIDPACFDLKEFTETWLEENKEAIDVIQCCTELPEIEDLRFRLENIDNKWYSKNEHSRTAYELGASNTFYWMRKETSK